MRLPEELGQRFWEELHSYEEEKQMPYITSVERIGREEGFKKGLEEGRQEGRQEGRDIGLREGLLDGIELALKLKFGAASQEIVPEIRNLTDLAVIRAVHANIAAALTVDELRRVYL